jgi:hypothetical protein
MNTEQELNSMSLQELRAEADYAAANPEPDEDVQYTRTVAGQVFTAGSETELGDMVAAAAEELIANAAKNNPAPARKERTADEEFCRAQDLQVNPTKIFKQMAAEEFGVPVGELKDRLQRLAEYESSQAAEEYVNTHPEFYPHPTSGARIQAAMREGNIPVTVDNIAKTVNSLREKGLLVERPAEFDPFSASLQALKSRANGLPLVDDSFDF